jgi:hypothetical protein
MKAGKEFVPILRKERELAKRRADLERDMTALAQEESELAITKRTLAKLLGVELDDEDQPEVGNAMALGRRVGGGKPKGTPSIREMATTLFRGTKEEWLETQEIVRLIKIRWWPSADRNDIAPTLWRLQKDGWLRKDGTKYALLKAATTEELLS